MKDKEQIPNFGIDVSKWNGQIDWNQVRSLGCEFAMIREGLILSILVDTYYPNNWKHIV